MANIFGVNNPGIGGLDEITDAEALFLQNLESLPYQAGDILYHDGTNLTRLAKGSDGQVLTLASGLPSWAAGGGSGDVVGPSSSTDNAIVRFDGTTGKLVQDSLATIDDSGTLTADSLYAQSSTFAVVSCIYTGAQSTTPKSYITIKNVDSSGQILSGNALGAIKFGGSLTLGGDSSQTAIAAFAAENWDFTTQGTTLKFYTTPNGTTTPVEAVQIGQDGTVSILANNLNITTSGATLQFAGVDTLSADTLGSSVVNSSLTSVGTITTGVWNGTAIGAAYGGTGADSSAATGMPRVVSGSWSFDATQDNLPDGTTYKKYNPAAVAITGGSITGITDLAVADGGTGASDAATARTNLGVDKATLGYMTDLIDDTTPQLGGELDAGANSIGFTLQTYTGVVGTTTIDWTKGNKAKFTFGAGNETLAFTAPSKPCAVQLIVVQDATGSRTITWPASVKWAGGTAPTLSTAANAVDIISFLYDGSSYYGTASLDFS